MFLLFFKSMDFIYKQTFYEMFAMLKSKKSKVLGVGDGPGSPSLTSQGQGKYSFPPIGGEAK
jgi:hypothetical protein